MSLKIINAGLNKLLPHSLEIEEIVLGAILLISKIPQSVFSSLKPEYFYSDANRQIYNAILILKSDRKPIDIIAVTAILRSQGLLESIGGAYYITGLTSRVSSSENIEYHIKLIHEFYLKRSLIKISNEASTECYNDMSDPFEEMNKVIIGVDQLKKDIFKRSEKSIGQLLSEVDSERFRPKINGLIGLSTGKKGLDYITQGDQGGQLRIKAARPAMGKCLGFDTGIIMFDGTIKKVQNIQVGDLLMGNDSKPRKVLSLATGIEQMYIVKQNKGISYRVNESHILSLKRSGTQGQTKHGDVLNINVKEFLSKSNKFKIRNKGYKTGIDFEYKNIGIDPYYLGLWLGDGNKSNQNISNPDIEIEDFLNEYCKKQGVVFKKYIYSDKCPELHLVYKKGENNPIKKQLENIGVLNNKHIPNDFISNSKEVRLNLLAGLIDTDGFYDKNNNIIEIIQVLKPLAQQIKYLCHTLGFACTIKEVTKGIKSINFKGQYHKLIISGDLHTIPIKVERKKPTVSKNKRNVLVTGIKVIKDKIDKYYGFTIDGNHLFLLEDTTVTHNTADMCSEMLSCVYDMATNEFLQKSDRIPVGCFSLEMSSVQLSFRILAACTEVDTIRIKKNTISNRESETIGEKSQILAQCGIYIDDTPGLTIDEFETKASLFVAMYGVKKIYIDYLQLMRGRNGKKYGNRESEVSDISRSLKIVAKELNITIIALCQLSREVEKRPNCMPMLSDLRESGSIEQDADIVEFLWRPEYYPEVVNRLEGSGGGLDISLFNFSITDFSGVLISIVAKCREEVTGKIPLMFKGNIMRVIDHNDVLSFLNVKKHYNSLPDIDFF
jgi:replicative DNA helicase